jgi:peptide/nickel transport system substrate-binding protein
VGLNQNLSSTSPGDFSGFQDPGVDALLMELRSSDDDDRSQEIIDEIQTIWDRDTPGVILAQQPTLIGWNPDVHGVVPTITSMVLFHDAFIAG